MAKDINIYRGYSNGNLDLSDGGRSTVRVGRSIKWKIDNRQAPGTLLVRSIDALVPKANSDFGIFITNPSKDGTEWKAKVKNENSVKGKQCEYAIHWTDSDGSSWQCDPIIAVKPTPVVERTLILGIVVAVVALVTLQLFRKKKSRKFTDGNLNM